MKSFTIFKDVGAWGIEYQLMYVNDKGVQEQNREIPKEILVHVQAIEETINQLKSEEELKVIELEKTVEQAFETIKQTLSDEQKISFVSLYPLFETEKEYNTGDEFQYQGKIYRVLQQHISQEHWKPTGALSLYVDIENKLNIQEFKQPTGSHDAYMINDKILFNGIEYLSIVNDNVWSPIDYPQGWQKIREE